MKRKILLKTIVVSLALITALGFSSFSDEADDIYLYGPAAMSHESSTISAADLENVVPDSSFDELRGSGLLKKSDISAISQIVVAESSAAAIMPTAASVYVGYPVNAPTPLVAEASAFPQATTTTGQVYNSTGLDTNLSNFTQRTFASTKVQDTSAPSYALININTKEIYATKEPNAKYNPSGLTNLMTAYIATRYLSMDTVLHVNASAVRGLDKDASIAALHAGDTITLRDAIASMFVKGCVDSSNVVAENVSGNITDFVKLMNTTATSLGLTNTNFVDPSGIGNNESTALDMSIIMAKVCENPELVELLKLYQYKLPKASKRGELILYSKNTQLNKENSTYNADVLASRLAYSSSSKYCISSLMNHNNNYVIAVVLKAEGTQFSATKKLFDFAKLVLTGNAK